MDANSKKKIIKIGLGAAGLVAVFFLGKLLAKGMYQGPEEKSASIETENTQQEAELQEPKAALTEDQIAELFENMKKVIDNGVAPVFQNVSSISQNAQGNEGKAGEVVSEDDTNIDFASLQEVNADVYAWITIPGTNIDYPILQHSKDNEYYLRHNIDGSYGYPGCIYTENFNEKDFNDPNTVIYGHNMRSKGTMFNQLHNFASKDFFDENNEIIIYLPDKTLRYKIFAAYTYDDRHLMYSFDFDQKDIYESYIKAIYDIRDMSANIDRELAVTSDDKIITLVTCMTDANITDKRYLVQAVLEEE